MPVAGARVGIGSPARDFPETLQFMFYWN